MKGAVAWMIAALLAACTARAGVASASVDRMERIWVGGHEYVRASDWARANRIELTWPQPRKTVRLANGTAAAMLTADSATALINGINVTLSAPTVVRGDTAYLAQLDLRSTIAPLLFPAKGSGLIRLVVLDPGHGGKDKGFLLGTQFEKTYTLLLGQEVRAQLTRAGLKATLTRTTDKFVERPDRPGLARKQKADLFVSLHFNSAGEGHREVKGVEVYCVTPVGASSSNARGVGADHGAVPGNQHDDENVLLAWQLQKSLVTELGLEDRGVKRARFEVLSQAAMPAVLIEGGFLSNPAESRRIFDPAFRRELAKAIVDGILAFKRTVEPEREGRRKK